MPTAAPVRTLKVSEFMSEEDAYVTLVQAILARAVADAQGQCSPTRGVSPAVLRAEAVHWLQDEDAVAALVELAGYESAPVLHRLRHVLRTSAAPVAEPQLTLL